MSDYASAFAALNESQASLAPPMPTQDDDPSGLLGLVDNLWDGVVQMGQGIGALLGTGYHDLSVLGAGLIPGEQAVEADGFLLDDFATAALPAMWEDLKTRYGPLLRGDLSEFGNQLYEKPLSFGLDALTVVGGLGAAARGAQGIGVWGQAAKALGMPVDEIAQGVALARTARTAELLGDVVPETIAKTGGLMDMVAVKEAAASVRLPGVVKFADKFSPETRTIASSNLALPEGSEAKFFGAAESKNPLIGLIQRKAGDRYLFDNASDLKNELSSLEAKVKVGAATPDERLRATQLSDTLHAMEKEGSYLMTTPRYETWRGKRLVNAVIGKHMSSAASVRADVLHSLTKDFTDHIPADQIDTFHEILMGGDHIPAITDITDEEMFSVLRQHGFSSSTEAAEKWLLEADPRADLLPGDVKRALWDRATRGDFGDFGQGDYVPSPEVLTSAERRRVAGEARLSIEGTNITDKEFGVGMMKLDSVAVALRNNDPARFATLDDVYRNLSFKPGEDVPEGDWLPQAEAAGVKGATEFGPDGSAMVSFFRTGDLTTMFHEGAHWFRRLLPEDIQDELAAYYHGQITAGNDPIGLGEITGDVKGTIHGVEFKTGDKVGFTVEDAEGVRTTKYATVRSVDGDEVTVRHADGETETVNTSEVAVDIFDVQGKVVAGNHPEHALAPGLHQADEGPARWRARNVEGSYEVIDDDGIPNVFDSRREAMAFIKENRPPDVELPTVTRAEIEEALTPAFTREMDERFARTVERYIFRAIEPFDGDHAPVFKAVREALARIWSQVRGVMRETDNIGDAEAAVMDRYLGDFVDRLAPPSDAAVWGGTTRRMRVITAAPSLVGRYGDGEQVAQGLPDVLAVRQAAKDAERQVWNDLHQLTGIPLKKTKLGDRIITHVKSEPRATARADALGAPPTDGLQVRLVLDSWRDVERVTAQIDEGGYKVLGAIDTRATPSVTGERGVTLKVADPRVEGHVFEIELGTQMYSQMMDTVHPTRTFMRDTGADLQRINGEAAILEEKLADPDTMSQLVVDGEWSSPEAAWAHLEDLHQQAAYAERELEAGQRRLQGAWEMVGDEVDHAYGGVVPNPQARVALNRGRAWVLGNPTGEEQLVAMGWSQQYLFERNYLSQRIGSGAKWVMDDEGAGDWVGGMSPYELDDLRAAKGLPQPMYFPLVAAPQSVSGMMMAGGKNLMMGGRKRAADPHMRRAEGSLLKTGDFITDPEGAYRHRALTFLKQRDTYELVSDILSKTARRISGPDDIQAGERIMAPDYMMRFFSAKVTLQDQYLSLLYKLKGQLGPDATKINARDLAREDVAQLLSEGLRGIYDGRHLDLVKDAGGSIEQVALAKAINDTLPQVQRSFLGATRQGIKLYAAPTHIANQIEKVMMKEFSASKMWWDKPTNFWRDMLLTFSPRWYINNVVGNLVFGTLDGTKFSDIIRAKVDPDFARMAERFRAAAPDDVDLGFFTGGMASSTGISMEGRAPRVRAGYNRTVSYAKAKNAAMENVSREASYLHNIDRALMNQRLDPTMKLFWRSKDKMERLMRDGVSPELAREAADGMMTAFGNYGNMSPFERGVIRRFIAPFWGFYRHVLKLTAKLPVEYPMKTQLIRVAALVNEDMKNDMGQLPGWMDGMIPFGKDTFISTAGANPFNVLTTSAMSMLHPVIKIAYEQTTGRSSFTGREFTDPDVVTPFGSNQKFRIIKDAQGRPIDAIPVSKVTPSLFEHIAQQFPAYEMAKDALAGGRTYDTTSLASALTNPEEAVPLDAATGEPYRPVTGIEQAAKFFGFSTFPFNVASYQTSIQDSRDAALKKALDIYMQRNSGVTVNNGLASLAEALA